MKSDPQNSAVASLQTTPADPGTDQGQSPPNQHLPPSEDIYRILFENAVTATFFIDNRSGLITKANARFEQLTGYPMHEVFDRMDLADFLSPQDQNTIALLRSNRKTSLKELACKIKQRQGAELNVLLKMDVVPELDAIVGSMVDVTHILRAECRIGEQQAQLSAILDAFEGQVYVSSPNYLLHYANDQLLQQIGRDAIGRHCFAALHNRNTPCPFCVMDQVRVGQTVRFEVKNPKDQRWYYSMNAPIRHVDGSISLLAMIFDINDRKLAEVAMRENEHTLRSENSILRSQINMRQKFGNIVGRSPKMQKVYEQILNAAATDATTIIYGEPGTGKELVARAIHDISERRNHRFVPVHCGAIPENLVESEFFGYKKGAFSGAGADKPGYLDYSDGGTLFLDEVGEISLHMQVKLLRVIEGGGYTPIGSNQVKTSNTRIIGATNRDLKERIREKMMREDFYYRIHILPIHLPSLRERKEDIEMLFDHFVSLYAGKRNLPPINSKMMEKLIQHNWPGNVRELQNVVLRYCNQKLIDLTDSMTRQLPLLPQDESIPSLFEGRGDFDSMLAECEKRLLIEALNQHGWHRGRVSELLKIDRKTLFNKMKRHGLTKTGNGAQAGSRTF